MSFFKLLFWSAITIIILLAWYIIPIMKPLPKPTGKYSVGFVSMGMATQREETFSPDSGEKRKLVLNVWYPIAGNINGYTNDYIKRPYLGEKMPIAQQLLAQKLNMPNWIGKLLLHGIKTHAYVDAPMPSEQQSYPVLLFSHGLLGEPSDSYTALCENIASHGYVVVGIDHTYFNLITRFADGTVVSCRELARTFQKMSMQEQYNFQRDAIAVYKEDMRSVLDYVKQLNNTEKSLFYKRLNLNCVGVAGHSAGGTAAIEFCRNNADCKVAVDLEGWYDHVIGPDPLNKPLLLIFGSKSVEISEPSTDYLRRKELTREQYFERENNIAAHRNRLADAPDAQLVILPNVGHGDFGDFVLLKWPLRGWQEVDGYGVLKKTTEHIMAFLSYYLCE